MIVAAIIPTHNRRASLEKVLNCLNKQVLPDNVCLEVIVVVDGSADGTNEMITRSFPEVHVIQGNGDWWYTHSINMGLQKALTLNATHFITLNDDVFFTSDYVAAITDGVKENDRTMIGSVSFTQSIPSRVTFSGIREVKGWRLKEISYLKKFSVVDVDEMSGTRPSQNLSGRGMFFTRAAVNELGLFDERFPQYGSDTDYSYRAFRLGFKVLVSYDAKIYENEVLTSAGAAYNNPKAGVYVKSLFNKYSVNSFSKSMLYFRKHGRKALWPAYLLSMITGAVYVYFFKYRNSR